MHDCSTTVLAQLISKRRKCFEQLRDLGRKQFELIAAGANGDLLRLLSAKQQLLAALELLERELAPFRDQPPESRVWASPEARARCAADAETCRQLMEEVVQMEQAGEREMTIRRDDVARQLRSVAEGSRVRDAYLANGMQARS